MLMKRWRVYIVKAVTNSKAITQVQWYNKNRHLFSNKNFDLFKWFKVNLLHIALSNLKFLFLFFQIWPFVWNLTRLLWKLKTNFYDRKVFGHFPYFMIQNVPDMFNGIQFILFLPLNLLFYLKFIFRQNIFLHIFILTNLTFFFKESNWEMKHFYN